jgi:hypothetical protein
MNHFQLLIGKVDQSLHPGRLQSFAFTLFAQALQYAKPVAMERLDEVETRAGK